MGDDDGQRAGRRVPALVVVPLDEDEGAAEGGDHEQDEGERTQGLGR